MQWDQQALVAGTQPLWWQIAERLRREIEFGGFKQGDVLPSEAALNQVFGVSRTTTRAALDKLEQEGLISRRAGKGSIVLPPQVIQPLSQMSSFAEDMRRRGFIASYKTLSARMVTPPAEAAAALVSSELARRLKVAKGSASLVARRLSHDAEQQPVEYAVVHYRADRYAFAIDLVRT